MRRLLAVLAMLAPIACPNLVRGQPGRLDTSFNPYLGIGYEITANVRCFAELTNGRVLFGGYFQRYDVFPQPYLGRAMAGGVRDKFNPGVNGTVTCITLQPDGKILIGGAFSSVAGTPRQRMARLNSNGTLDTTFAPGSGANSTVASIILQDDGKMVVGGAFTNFDGVACSGVVRLNTNGALDAGFNVSLAPFRWSGSGSVNGIVAQSDGKMLVHGEFTAVNGVARTNLVRLHSDGSVDTAFDPGRGSTIVPRALAVQPDGRLVIGDYYYSIIRLNTDGSRDATFNAGRGEIGLGWLNGLTAQSDGKIVVFGSFNEIDGFPRNRLARLNADGTFDWSFHSGAGPANPALNGPSVLAAHVQSNGSILIGGNFATVDGVSRRGIARVLGGDLPPGPPSILTQPTHLTLRRYQPLELRVDGTSFETPSIEWRRNGALIPGATNRVFSIPFAQLTDAGDYTSVLRNSAGAVTSQVAVVQVEPVEKGPGALDVTYFPSTTDSVHRVTLDASGRALVASGYVFAKLERLKIDGSVDSSFKLGGEISGLDGSDIYAVAVHSDSRLVVGGWFVGIGAAIRHNITILEPDGATDPGFVPQPGTTDSVNDIALDEDGKVVVVGWFASVNGEPRRRVARFNADGSLDNTFNIGTGAYHGVQAVVRQPDGKFIIGGGFTNFNEVPMGRVARLNTNGSVDASFTIGAGANGGVNSLALQVDGKILVGGVFTNFAGSTRHGIARLNGDGTLDTSFASPLSLAVEAMVLQPDGKVIVGGNFATGTIPIRRNVVRLNVDGSLDESFAPGISMDGTVYTVALQSDGRVLIGGSFTTVNGYPRNHLARLEVDQSVPPGPLRIRDYALLENGNFRLRFTYTPGATNSVLSSTDLANWEELGAAPEIQPGRFEFMDSAMANRASRFYRVIAQ